MATYKKTNHPGIKALEQPEKTCRHWQLTVSLGRKADGSGYDKRRRNVEGTLTEAKELYTQFKQELKQSSICPDLGNLTFKQFSDQWQDERKKGGELAAGTLRKTDYHLSLVVPYIGNVKMSRLSVDTFKRLFAILRSEGGRLGNGISGATARNVYATVNSVMLDAAQRGAIKENPLAKVKRPKCDTKEKEAMPMGEAKRLASLLMQGEPDAHTVAYLLALSCGLRREEICGLRWCDFDAASHLLRISHAFPADTLELSEPKTEASKRAVPLDQSVYARLCEWWTVQADQFKAARLKRPLSTPVCSSEDFGFIHPENLGRSWRRFAKRNNFGDYSLHQLRHTFATILVSKGVNIKAAAAIMGHSNTDMLTKVYAHVVPEDLVRATSLVGASLFESTVSANDLKVIGAKAKTA